MNKTLRKITALLLCAVLAFTLAACQSKQEAQSASGIDLTDQAGRSVHLDSFPERIVSGYFISTSTLIALGQSSKIVGVEAKAGSRPIYALSAPELLELPNTGSAKNFDLEGCAALEPDLVILPKKLASQAEALESMGFKTLLVNPEDEELLNEMIKLLAAATGSSERGEELISFAEKTQAELAEKLKGADEPKVYLCGNSEFLTTCGPEMYQSSLIDCAGGANVAEEIKDNYWANISYEQLLAWDPEYIIIPAQAEFDVATVLADSALSGCTAVKNGNVYQMPYDYEGWDNPVPSGTLGMLWVAGKLHPDMVSEEYLNDAIKDFYKEFYGVEK